MAGESARSGVADEKRYRIIAWWAREGRERNRVPPWLMSKFRLPMPEIQQLDSFQCTRVLPCVHRENAQTSLLRDSFESWFPGRADVPSVERKGICVHGFHG